MSHIYIMPPKRNERQASKGNQDSEALSEKITRSKSTSVDRDRDQPKITDALAMSSIVEPTSPATSADITKILEKLEKIQEDNTDIKSQLKDIKNSVQTQIDTINNRVSDLENSTKNENIETKNDIKTIQETVKSLENSINFQGDEMDSQKKELTEMKKSQKQIESRQTEMEQRENKLKKEIESLTAKNLDMERHYRKNNLLLYGIIETPGENIFSVVKTFLKGEAKLSEEAVNQMVFVNAHRLPHMGTGPMPIIVRFVSWIDRQLVLGQVFKGVLPKGMNILTDLPPVMKAERHRLFAIATTLRKSEGHYKTRVIERGSKLQLQFRKNNKESWVNHKE